MPNEQKVTRKLRAILSADVKGYSLLMSDDEIHTIQTLKAYRQMLSEYVQQHTGRVVDSPGDNILAEFASAVDAVQCAVEIQKKLKRENERFVEDKRIQFRIGVNIGDVVQDGDRIYGNGVNVAARIEGLAEPGGVSISRNAYDHIRDKMELGYDYLGEHRVKNIKHPVRVYKVLMDPVDAGKLLGEEPRTARKKWYLPVAVIATIIVTSVVWFSIQSITKQDIEPASKDEMAFPLPDKPSLAVLPFENMSGDPKQEHVSDGITESIITAVSKIRHLFVIARNSTSTYKGKAVKIQQVAKDLGVQYVLEGSVQRSGDKLRVTAQLIDALNGSHIWAEQYDRKLKDLFEIQDEITLEILEAMRIKLIEGEQVLKAKRPQNVQSALKIYQAQEYSLRFTPEAMAMAKKIAEEVIAVEPDYGEANYILSTIHMMEYWFGMGKSPEDSLLKATGFAEKAISLDESLSQAMGILGYLYGIKKQWDKSVAVAEKGVSIDPNGADAHAWLGNCLNFAYRYQDAIPFYEKAMRLNPYPPAWYYFTFAISYINLGRNGEAIALLEKSLSISPNSLSSYVTIIRPYLNSGRKEEARAAAQKVLQINPKFSVEDWVGKMSYKEQDYANKVSDALLKAGLPNKQKPTLPDKPSIAVLPFDNLSDDPEQEYFSDGMTDDIITDLSKISGLMVISRNSTFTFKGKDIKIPEAAKELGVRYVLEGSVRRAGDQVRINAQLIDATTDHHVWAERFDDKYENIFELQDKITARIVSALALKLSTPEQHIIADKGTPNVDAYNAYLKGMSYMRRFTPDDYVKAIGYFKQAIELDRNYSQAYAALAYTYWNTFASGKSFWDKIGIDYATSRIFARHYLGLAMKKPTSRGYQLMAFMEQYRRHYKEAIEYAERAVTISPNDADALSDLGFLLVWTDNPEAGIKNFKKSIMLDPLHRGTMGLGMAHFSMGDYEKTLRYIDIGITDNPERTPFLAFTAAAHAFIGNGIEANKALNKWLGNFEGEVNPSVQMLYYLYPYNNSKVFDRLLEGLVKAGYQADHIGYYKVDEKNKLRGQEIERLIVGKVITGYISGLQWSTSPLEDSNFVMSVSMDGFILYEYNGKSWVEGDSRCLQYEDRFEGIKHCADYFYNPEGEEISKTEYIMVNDYGIFPFSVVE